MPASITQLTALLAHLNRNDATNPAGVYAINLFFSNVVQYILTYPDPNITPIKNALSPRQIARLQSPGQPGGEPGTTSFAPTIHSLVTLAPPKNNDWVPSVSTSIIGCLPAYPKPLFKATPPPYTPSDPIAYQILEWPFSGNPNAKTMADKILLDLNKQLVVAMTPPPNANKLVNAERLNFVISVLQIDKP